MKTLGNVSADLIARLYDENRPVFTVNDVVRINATSHQTAAKLIFDLVKRKVVFRIKRGKYIIIPQELGSVETYLGNWYVAAREVTNSPDYYVAFYSAMKFRGMTTAPIVKIYIATPQRQSPPKILEDKIVFVCADRKSIWGIKNEWVTKTETVRISDFEKTIVDGLAHPEYCGGITEIAKGMWLVKNRLDIDKLVRYVIKYNKNAVAKRLGYILEILNIGRDDITARLRKYVKDRYDLFDPTAERKVMGKNHWRLVDNIGSEQIKKIISA